MPKQKASAELRRGIWSWCWVLMSRSWKRPVGSNSSEWWFLALVSVILFPDVSFFVLKKLYNFVKSDILMLYYFIAEFTYSLLMENWAGLHLLCVWMHNAYEFIFWVKFEILLKATQVIYNKGITAQIKTHSPLLSDLSTSI